MEIEIVTMKRRMTKSLVAQMPRITDDNYEIIFDGVILGHIRNVIKNEDKTILIKFDGEYYTVSSNLGVYKETDMSNVETGEFSFHFGDNSVFIRDETFDSLQTKIEKILKKAEEPHIYVHY